MTQLIRYKYPHGSLMAGGKKTAHVEADGEKLPVGRPILVMEGLYPAGVVTLEDPARMLVSEFDRKEWQLRHRVYKREREAWWPGETAFCVYHVAKFVKAEGFSGVAVGLFLEPDAGLAIEGGEKAEDLHVTLAMLGEPRDNDRDKLDAVLKKFCAGKKPIRGKVSGKGTFDLDGGGYAHWAHFDSPDLPEFRQELMKAVGAEDNEHGFTPHITLKYGTSKEPPEFKGGQELIFNELTLAWGNERTRYPLSGEPDAGTETEKQEASKMPYEIIEQEDRYCVQNTETDEIEACHDTEEEAQAHLAALNINVVAEEMEDVAEGQAEKDDLEGALKQALDRIGELEAKLRAKKDDERVELAAELDEKQEFDESEWDGAAANWPDAASYCNDCLLDFNPSGEDKTKALCKLPFRYPGKPPNKAALRALAGGARGINATTKPADVSQSEFDSQIAAAKEKLRGWWPGAFDKEPPDSLKEATIESEQDEKAGRRVKRPMKQVLREIYEKLKEVLTWADYEDDKEDEGPVDSFFKAGIGIKQVDGEPWIVTYSTNAFEDRQGEIFSTAGLERYVAEAEEREDKGFFDFWHIDGTEFAVKKWQAVVGRFLVEAGPFTDDHAGRAMKKFLTEHPEGHPDFASEGWGCSPQFIYLPEERKTGTYDNFWIEKTAILGRFSAANIWTKVATEVSVMNQKQREAAVEIFGEEFVEGIEQQAKEKTAELEAANVAHKEIEEEAPVEEETPETEETPEIQVDVEALGAELVKQFQVDLTPLTEAVEANANTIKEQGALIQALMERISDEAKAEAEKQADESPRFLVHLSQRASQAESTKVEGEDPLLKMKPEEATHVDGSAASAYFGSK